MDWRLAGRGDRRPGAPCRKTLPVVRPAVGSCPVERAPAPVGARAWSRRSGSPTTPAAEGEPGVDGGLIDPDRKAIRQPHRERAAPGDAPLRSVLVEERRPGR